MANLRKERIHAALRDVHKNERCTRNPGGLPRATAVKQAIEKHALSSAEREVLLNATHVAAGEIEPSIQPSEG